MNIFDKLYGTLFVITLILFTIGLCLTIIYLVEGCTLPKADAEKVEKHGVIAWRLMIPFLIIFTVTLVYLIFVELILDGIWGMNIHLPFSFLQS